MRPSQPQSVRRVVVSLLELVGLAVGFVALIVDPLVVPLLPAVVPLIVPVVDSVLVDRAVLAAALSALVAPGVASPPVPTPLSKVPPLPEAASPEETAALAAPALPAVAAALSLGWAPAGKAKATPMPIATRVRLPGVSSLGGVMERSGVAPRRRAGFPQVGKVHTRSRVARDPGRPWRRCGSGAVALCRRQARAHRPRA